MAPGNKLTTYYEDNSYRTIAIQLEMDDQSVYSISELDTSEEDYHYDELELNGKVATSLNFKRRFQFYS